MEEALNNMQMPDNPVTDIEQAAISWRAVYDAFLNVEFSQGQALYLASAFILGHPGTAPNRG